MFLLKEIYFQTDLMKQLFTYELIALLVTELFVALLVIHNFIKRKGKVKSMDNGSGLLLLFGAIGSVVLQPLCINGFGYLMPYFMFWIGFGLVLAGIIIRIIGVFSLRKEYSFFVIITENTKLVKDGIFHIFRNPAYLGSQIIMFGISLIYRCPLGVFMCVVDNAIVYGYRIAMEEAALERRFQNEYVSYEQKTYRLIPYIW